MNDLAGWARRGVYLAYAAGAVGAITGLQALPALAAPTWGVDDRLVVSVAATVTSVQVGQTIGIQNLLNGRLPAVARPLGAVLAAVAAVVVALVPEGVVALVGAGVLGGILGVATAVRTVDLLVPGGRTAYQRAYCVRNLLWLAALAGVGAAGWLSVRSFVVLTVVSWLVADLLDRATRPHAAASDASDALVASSTSSSAPPAVAGVAALPSASLVTLAVGFGSALLYRNDVNAVRLAVEGTPAFARLHFVLLAHAFVVAVVGFLTGQLLYPALRGGGHVPVSLLRRLRTAVAVVAVVAVALAGAGAAVGGAWREAGLIAAGTAMAAWNPLASAALHASRRSLAVYLPLVACFGGLTLGVRVDPAAAFAAYNAAVAVALGGGLVVLARRQAPADVPSPTRERRPAALVGDAA